MHVLVEMMGVWCCCRLYLAALHFNENSDREQAVDKEGKPRFSVRFPKFKKGGYSVHKEMANPTYGRQ